MDLPREAVLERITRADPRIVVVVTPPGWGKTFVGSELLKSARSGVLCAFSGVRDIHDVEARISAVFGTMGWTGGDHDVAVLDDLHELHAAGGTERLAALLKSLPADRRLVLLSRKPLSVDIFRYAAPHEVLTLRQGDIALTRDECRRAFAAEELPHAVRERAVDLCAGWPIATLLMSRLAREGRLAESLENLTGDALGDLHTYVYGHVLADLSDGERAAVTACAAIPNARSEDVSAALGYEAEPTLRALAGARLHYIWTEDGAYVLHPIVAASIRAFEPAALDALARSASNALAGSGRFLRAAKLALLAGDVTAAAAALDRSGPYAGGESMSPEYFEIASALPLEEIFASKHIFLDFFGSRLARSRPYELCERVSKYCESLAPDVPALVRYSARIALFIMLRTSQQLREADTVAHECIAMAGAFPQWTDRRMILMCDFACLLCMLGKVEQAEALWKQLHADAPDGPTFFSLQLAILTYSATLYRGERMQLMEMLERSIAVSRRWNDAPSLIVSLGGRALANAVFDPHISLAAELAALQPNPAQSRFFYHSARVLDDEDAHPTVTGCFLTIEAALTQIDVPLATRLLDNAIVGFDRIGQPYWRIIARMARLGIPGPNDARLLGECRTLSEEIEVPTLVAQVAAYVQGRDLPGPYSGVLERIRKSALIRGAAQLRINVMRASVTRGSVEIPIRQRELEVAAVLALAGAPVSVEELCERVWPAADTDAAVSALRMSITLRRQLGDGDVVISVAAGYAFSDEVAVDIAEAEQIVVAARRLRQLDDGTYTRLRALFDELTTNRNILERQAWHALADARIQAVRHALGALLSRHDIAHNNAVAALETAEALLRFDPLDEPAVELAVRALVAAGDHGEAAHRWRLYAARLDEEFAAHPFTTLQEIIDDCLAR